MVFGFLCLTSLGMITLRSIHVTANGCWLGPSLSPETVTSARAHERVFPEHPCLHSEPQLWLPRRPSRPAGGSGPDPSGVAALAWVPVCVKPCVCSPRVESLFPRFLWTQAPLTIKVKCSGDLSSQCLTPP